MANRFFAPGRQRAEKVEELFTAIAPRYDLINDLQSFGLHRRWKRRVIQLAGVRPGESAIDVCCGTGDLALSLAQSGAETIGLDFNAQMLRIAEERKSKLKMEQRISNDDFSKHLRFVRCDAQHLPFPDGSFDVVTIGYGLRNLASWETGLEEMRRVARPGGRLLVLEFGKPDLRLWRTLYFAYLRFFVPLLGLVFCGDAGAYAYILESLKHYPGQAGVAKKMQQMGMSQVRIVNLLGGAMSINYGCRAD